MKLQTVLILVFATSAFAPLLPAPVASQPAGPAQEQKATNPPATATKATLYVYRLRDRQGMSNKPSVYIDERELAWIENGRFFVVNIDPGEHVVRSNDKASAVILEMKPGQDYYIRVAFPNQNAVRAEVALVPPEQGLSEIEQTEPSKPKDIRDHELVVAGAMRSKPASVPAFAQQQPAPAASQPADPAQQEPKATNPSASAAKATLYVYRLRDVSGMFNKPSVYIDEREVARIENGRFFVVRIDPGQHVVRSDYKAAALTLEVKPGRDYYVRVAFEPTQYSVRAATRLMEPEQGWSEIGQTTSSDPKYIKDHELAAVGAMPSKPAPVPAPAVDLSVPGGGAAGTCRSIAVTFSWFSDGYKVVDVVNYPGAYVGKWYDTNALPTVQTRDGVHILVLTKGYTPEDVARAHSFCQSGAKEAERAQQPPPKPSETTPSLASPQETKPNVKTGEIMEGKLYKSGRGMFSVTVPAAANPFVRTYKLRESQLKNENYDYEEVVFHIDDFGQAYGAAVRRIPQAVLAQMAKEEEKQTLSNLANIALFKYRDNYAEEPQPVEENSVQTQFGAGLLRIYLAKRSSLIERMVGGGRISDLKGEKIDTHIAVLVVKKGDWFIYATAEDDDLQSRSAGRLPPGPFDPKPILTKALQSFFASMTVKF